MRLRLTALFLCGFLCGCSIPGQGGRLQPTTGGPSIAKAFPIIKEGSGSSTPLVEVYDASGPVNVLKARILWSWTDEALLISGQVFDKNLQIPDLQPENYNEGHKYDSVEFRVGDRRYSAGLTASGTFIWSFSDKGSSPSGKASFEKNADGYAIKVSLPWSELGIVPEVGRGLRLAFGVNDRSSASAEPVQSYMPVDLVKDSPGSFAKCVLALEFQPDRHRQEFRKDELYFSYPGATEMNGITVEINLEKPLGPVSRNILGACAYAPPWPPEIEELYRPFLESSSIRVWLRGDSKWNSSWAKLREDVKPGWTLAFTDGGHHPEKASYKSETDNNLKGGFQSPKSIVALLRSVLGKGGIKIDAYELWNEPEFAANGAWPAKDMARYVRDCSAAIKKEIPSIMVGSFLTSKAWNREFLETVEKGSIDFVDHHYYDTRWFKAGNSGKGAYTGKVVYSTIVKERVRSDIEDIRQSKHEGLKLVSSEWGVHPKTYGAPFTVCHDIGAVISHASFLITFWEEGLYAAQYFHLSSAGDSPLSHFRLINQRHQEAGRGNLLLFQLFGSNFKGRRLDVSVKAPSIKDGLKGDIPTEAQVVQSTAALWDSSKRLCVVLINKHVDLPAEVRLESLPSEWSATELSELNAPDLDSTEVIVSHPQPGMPGARNFTLNPHSILFVSFERK